MEWSFFIDTYGCKVNQYESQQIREAWIAQGGRETLDAASADYILINSCAITANGERDARNAIFRMRRTSPCAKIILTGCAAQFYSQFQPRKNVNFAQPDICVDQKNKSILLDGPKIDALKKNTRNVFINDYYRNRPVIKIQDGCSQNCAYCIVPQTRGKPQSRPKADILEECQKLAAKGYGELVLSGINLRQFRNNGDFWDLIHYLDQSLAPEFQERMRLRISSIDPAMLNERGIGILLECRLICPQLHLSIQHASDRILELMGRKHYSARSVEDNILKLKQKWKNMGLGADLLVGFPGETQKDFDELLEFVELLPFTYAHIFPFSARQGTKAQKMPNQICRHEKESRAKRLREIISKKKRNYWQQQSEMDIMTIAPDETQCQNEYGHGINEYYVPCVFLRKAGQIPAPGLLRGRPLRSHREGIEVEIID